MCTETIFTVHISLKVIVAKALNLIDKIVFSSIYSPAIVSDISGFFAQVSTNMIQGEGNDQVQLECSDEKIEKKNSEIRSNTL